MTAIRVFFFQVRVFFFKFQKKGKGDTHTLPPLVAYLNRINDLKEFTIYQNVQSLNKSLKEFYNSFCRLIKNR